MGRCWAICKKARGPRFLDGGSWSRGVTVSTLDSESSNRGSNPRGTFFASCAQDFCAMVSCGIFKLFKASCRFPCRVPRKRPSFQQFPEGAARVSTGFLQVSIFDGRRTRVSFAKVSREFYSLPRAGFYSASIQVVRGLPGFQVSHKHVSCEFPQLCCKFD